MASIRALLVRVAAACLVLGALQATEQPAAARDGEPNGIQWLTDYGDAVRQARDRQKLLLVYFFEPGDHSPCARFESTTLSDPEVVEKLSGYVCLRLPIDAEVRVAGTDKSIVLLQHAAFRHMEGKPGLAIIDYAHPETKHYGLVVSCFPFLNGRAYTVGEVQTMLTLPPGTLTQRTLIYAVRIHSERPASTEGELDPTLIEEAAAHAEHQARIGVQGHHNWETRFHRINARLPRRLLACEVCAESWPGQGLLEAAIECVRCWRLSPGHWEAVRQRHPRYAYDMKRGANGVWYATGIFGRLSPW